MNTAAGAVGLLLALIPPAIAQSPTSQTVRYTCDQRNPFSVVFSGETARVSLAPKQIVTLRRVRSASGARYVSGSTVLLMKGNQALLEIDPAQIYRCRSQSIAPRSAAVVTGTVFYLQRIALPPSAVVEVKLLDVSRLDAPAVTIAEQTLPTKGKQVPISFSLAYDPSKILPTHDYVVQARILVDGSPRWINTSRYAVITQGNLTQVDVRVDRVNSNNQPN